MGSSTTINYLYDRDGRPGATWNMAEGCTPAGAGCANCYAEAVAQRFSGPGQVYEGVVNADGWAGVRERPDKLSKPLRWQRPRRILAPSMGDLFHREIADEYIAAVAGVVAGSPKHTFLTTTKRPERVLEWFEWHAAVARLRRRGRVEEAAERASLAFPDVFSIGRLSDGLVDVGHDAWPLPNWWFGWSAWDQASLDAGAEHFRRLPNGVPTWISLEPLLGPVDLRGHGLPCKQELWAGPDTISAARGRPAFLGGPFVSFVVVGGESGTNARPCDVAWILSVVAQCRAAGVPCWVKQLGAVSTWDGIGHDQAGACEIEMKQSGGRAVRGFKFRHRAGADPSEWPADIRVREVPRGWP